MTRVSYTVLAAATLLCGCTSGETPTDETPPRVQPKSAPEAEPPIDAPQADSGPAEPTPPPVQVQEIGPLDAADATTQQRADAVLAILAGGPKLEQLPELAAEPGREFDPYLEQAMRPRAPISKAQIRQGNATISEGLPKEVVRRIVRQHIAEIRACYQRGLDTQPKLGGTITMAFEITSAGAVAKAKVAKSTVADEAVGKCVAKRAKAWKFPPPSGGATVTVRYPLTLSSN